MWHARATAILLRSERRYAAPAIISLTMPSWLDLKLGLRMLVKYPGLAIMLVVGLISAVGHARRGLRLDPSESLKEDG